MLIHAEGFESVIALAIKCTSKGRNRRVSVTVTVAVSQLTFELRKSCSPKSPLRHIALYNNNCMILLYEDYVHNVMKLLHTISP